MLLSCNEVRCGGGPANAFETEFYLITFASASHCIETEIKAKERFQVHIIPTPREITASCGMALRFQSADRAAATVFLRELDVPSQLYAMGPREAGGKRRSRKLEEQRAE